MILNIKTSMQRIPYLTICLLLIIILKSNEIYSQYINSVNINSLGISQGITSTNVRKIIEEKAGFIWFSTQDGLNKYNGTHIVQFTKANKNIKRQLIGSDCFEMQYVEENDLLYVLAAYDGLTVINTITDAVVNKVSAKDLLQSENPIFLQKMLRVNEFIVIVTEHLVIYFSTITNKIIKRIAYNNNSKQIVQEAFEYGNYICLLMADGVLEYYSKKDFQFIKKKRIDGKMPFINSVTFNKRELWISTSSGPIVYDVDKGVKIKNSNFLGGSAAFLNNVNTSAISIFDEKIYLSNADGFFLIENNKAVQLASNNNNEQKKFF